MSDCDFTIDDNGLAKDIQAFYDAYPSEAVSCIRSVARAFAKDVNKKFPNGGTTGGSKSVKKKWKYTNVSGLSGMTCEVDVTNSSPLFHLVENGHELYLSEEMYAAYKAGELHTNGSKSSSAKQSANLVHAGFVPGKHYCADTRDEYNNGKYAQTVTAKIDKLLSEHDL